MNHISQYNYILFHLVSYNTVSFYLQPSELIIEVGIITLQ